MKFYSFIAFIEKGLLLKEPMSLTSTIDIFCPSHIKWLEIRDMLLLYNFKYYDYDLIVRMLKNLDHPLANWLRDVMARNEFPKFTL